MIVIYTAQCFQEIRQVFLFGEPRRLRCIIEPYIHYLADLVSSERIEELLGALLGKTDGINFHEVTVHQGCNFDG